MNSWHKVCPSRAVPLPPVFISSNRVGETPVYAKDGYLYQIRGEGSGQFLDVWMAPGKKMVSEAGAMVSLSGNIAMSVVLGTSETQLGRIVESVKRKWSGEEGFFINVYQNTGLQPESLALAAPGFSSIVGVDASQLGVLNVRQGTYFAGTPAAKPGVGITANVAAGAFSGIGFAFQSVKDGVAFFGANGSPDVMYLLEGQKHPVDPGNLLAYEASMSVSIATPATNVVDAFMIRQFGGEKVLMAEFTGPGLLITQSISRGR